MLRLFKSTCVSCHFQIIFEDRFFLWHKGLWLPACFEPNLFWLKSEWSTLHWHDDRYLIYLCRPKSGSSVWNLFKGDASLSAAAGEIRWGGEHLSKLKKPKLCRRKLRAWRVWKDCQPWARSQTVPLKAALWTKAVSWTSLAGGSCSL